MEASLVEASSCKIIARIDWADMLDPLCRGREGPCLLNAKMWQKGANVRTCACAGRSAKIPQNARISSCYA